MNPEDYLKLIKRLNILISHKCSEKEELFTLATKTTQENDDMPHASGISDKVGNLSVKIALKEQEIDNTIDLYIDLKNEIIAQLQKLPTDEYQVLYDYYVLGKKLWEIASDRDQSIDWIKKLKWRGISMVTVNETETYKKVLNILVT